MKTVPALIRLLDTLTEIIGRIASCFALLLVVVTCYIVVTRYVFNTGSVAVQESLIYINSILVFVSIGFTLRHNAHVRVDIFYSRMSDRGKAWVNLLGTILLLLPVCVFLLWSCWSYVMSSWAILEGSREARGLPYVYLLKTLILVMPALLLLQGLAEFLRNLAVLFLQGDADFLEEEPAVSEVL